jgi:DinB superfamily/Pentapeptide repeats (8 copies)
VKLNERDADLTGSRFRNVDLSGSQLRSVFLRGVTITDSWIEDVSLEGHIVSLTVNGVDVAAYVEAELDRRHPDRVGLRARDVPELRQAWAEAVRRADETVERARRLPADRLDEQVEDEYSFIQTLRHLVFGFDRWLSGPVFGDPRPSFHPLGLVHEGAEEGSADGLDLSAQPTLDEVLVVRRTQQQRLGEALRNMTDAEVHRSVGSPNGGETTVLHCVQVVLKEEWWHHQYATRDLAILEK